MFANPTNAFAAVLSLLTVTLCVSAQQPQVQDLGLLPHDAAVGPAPNSQQDHSIARGGDQYLVAWTDYRARSVNSQAVQSDGDVFGIRLDASGAPIDSVPFLIAGGMGLQQRPIVAWNGENWMVLYHSQDPVGGYFETQLRAVRVSPQGAILDSPPILLPPTQFSPNNIGLQLAGQSGQWLVTRCVYHDDGYGTFLAGQRIDGNGQLLDLNPVVLIDWVYGSTINVVGPGEYLVAGPDWNNSATIKARRVGLNGQAIGSEFNLPSLNVAGNGTEYYVAWMVDFGTLLGSRMTSTGTLLTPGGTVLVSGFSQYTHCTLAHDGINWWMEWGVSDILRTLRINALGTVLDLNGGVLLPVTIGGNVNTAYNTMLVSRPGGGVHLLWYDLRVALGYDTNTWLLPISADNVAGVERCVSTSSRNQRSVDVAEGPSGQTAVAFVSELAHDDRVMVQFLNANGSPSAAAPIEVAHVPTIGKCGIAWNGNMYMIAWDESTTGSTPTQIKFRRMNPDGTFVDAAPIDVMIGFTPDVGALGDDFLIVGARYGISPQYITLYGRRYDGPTGAALDASSLALAGGYVNAEARVRADNSRWLVTGHSMWTHDSSQGDAFMVRVPPYPAPPESAFNPTPISGATGDLDIAFSGDVYLLVWRMNSLANANNYVAGRIMNADGSYPGGYFVISEAPGRQLRPTVAWNGSEFIVAWEDQRNQESFFDARTDIYATRVSETGAVLDANGWPVVESVHGVAGAAILSRQPGHCLLASARFTLSQTFDSYRIGITSIGHAPRPADITGDGVVGVPDLLAVLNAWGACGTPCPADVAPPPSGDGVVGVADLLFIINNWG